MLRFCSNEVRRSVGEREVVLEDLIKEFGNVEERAKCKKLKKELEDARLDNTILSMQKERVERDLHWTRVQAYEFYQEMIHRGVVFEERPNEAIDVPVKDEESPSSEPRGSPRFLLCRDRIMPPKLGPLTQVAIERMITSRVNKALAADRARRVNAGEASGSRQGGAPAARECTFSGFMKCNPTVFHGTEGAVELRRWFEKTEMVFGISEYEANDECRVLPNRRSSKDGARVVESEG
ncbi:hypothetical protein Tco_1090427 [Tanacetum coccineum]|uniref:Reverse transcriptase domain-containing protein n=1 Tax=Tanacetum coccineum TaxID=301880 RepID=A0ABQ5I560_9ASTR